MIGPLASLIGAPKMIAIAAACVAFAGVAGWAYVEHGRVTSREATIAQQRQQLDLITAANASLSETLDRRDRWQARQLAILSADRDAALSRTATATKIIQAVRNAKPTDDAPIAPVLRLALDGLRKPGTAPGGAKPSGAAGDPARPAGLPGKP